MSTDRENLLSPLAATSSSCVSLRRHQAVDEYPALRVAAASGNDHRLGGHERRRAFHLHRNDLETHPHSSISAAARHPATAA
ncbi:MAG: hypothetical protein ACLVJ6_03735 [Merdibacter sp.]